LKRGLFPVLSLEKKNALPATAISKIGQKNCNMQFNNAASWYPLPL
jgi:hypothetical protein